MPPLDAVAGVALKQKAVRFHDPVHALDVHRRAAFVAATSPDQRVHSAIAVSRLTRDHLLDLGQQLGLALRRPPASARRNLRLGGEV